MKLQSQQLFKLRIKKINLIWKISILNSFLMIEKQKVNWHTMATMKSRAFSCSTPQLWSLLPRPLQHHIYQPAHTKTQLIHSDLNFLLDLSDLIFAAFNMWCFLECFCCCICLFIYLYFYCQEMLNAMKGTWYSSILRVQEEKGN